MSRLTKDKNPILRHDQTDGDHRKLFDLVDQLAAAVIAGEEMDVCATIIDRLIDQLIGYTRSRFATEACLMTRHCYAQAAAQKAEHDDFIDKVVNLRQKIGSGSAVLSIETLSVMRDWLNDHVGSAWAARTTAWISKEQT